MAKSDYIHGLNMNVFNPILQVSRYNNTYYEGFNKDLLFAKSDDDNTTEWWLIVNGDKKYLGESYANQGDLLYVYEKQQT
jgi:hypothetical protein